MRRAKGAVRAALLAALVVVALRSSGGGASLGRPPIDFTVSPRVAAPEQSITIRVTPVPAASWLAGSRVDVYVMWATTERAAFLRPDGVWSPTPVAVRPGMDATSPPMVMEWRRPEPRGDIPLAMLAVPSGADPLLRSSWRYHPLLRSTRVAIGAPQRSTDIAIAASLLSATGLAILVVAILPWAPRGASAQPRPVRPTSI